VDQPHSHVFAHLCRHDDRQLVALHNLSATACVVSLDLSGVVLPGEDSSTVLVDLLRDEGPLAIDDRGRCDVALEGYGYRWLRVRSGDSLRLG
jgi:hypothetical protein